MNKVYKISLVPKFLKGAGNWFTRLFNGKQRRTKEAYENAESNYLAQNLAAQFNDNNLNKDWMSTGKDGKIHVDYTKYNIWANSDEGKSYIKDFKETDNFKKYRSTWDNYYKLNEEEGLEGIRRFGSDFVDYVNNAVYYDPTEQVVLQDLTAPNPYREEFRSKINTTFNIPSFGISPLYTPVGFNPLLSSTVSNPTELKAYTPKYNLDYNQIANWYNNSQRLADLNNYMNRKEGSSWQNINDYSDITPEIIDRIYDYLGQQGVGLDGKVGNRTMERRLVPRTLLYTSPYKSREETIRGLEYLWDNGYVDRSKYSSRSAFVDGIYRGNTDEAYQNYKKGNRVSSVIQYSNVGPYRDGYRGLSSTKRRLVVTPKPYANTKKLPTRTYSSNPWEVSEVDRINSWNELMHDKYIGIK